MLLSFAEIFLRVLVEMSQNEGIREMRLGRDACRLAPGRSAGNVTSIAGGGFWDDFFNDFVADSLYAGQTIDLGGVDAHPGEDHCGQAEQRDERRTERDAVLCAGALTLVCTGKSILLFFSDNHPHSCVFSGGMVF